MTAGAIEIVAGIPRQRAAGRADYTLRIKSAPVAQPVAVALVEAKPEKYPPTHGLQQGKVYASSKRLNAPLVYSSNGHQFVEYDSFTGLTHAPRPMSEFPSPDALRVRYEQGKGFQLDSLMRLSHFLPPMPKEKAREDTIRMRRYERYWRRWLLGRIEPCSPLPLVLGRHSLQSTS